MSDLQRHTGLLIANRLLIALLLMPVALARAQEAPSGQRIVLDAELSGARARLADDSLKRWGAAAALRLNVRRTPTVWPLLVIAVARADTRGSDTVSVSERFLLGGIRWSPLRGRFAPFVDVAAGVVSASLDKGAVVETWPLGLLFGAGARIGNERTAIVIGYETFGPIAGGYIFETWRLGLRRRLIG